MNLSEQYESLNLNIELEKLTEIAKDCALLGSKILKNNYKKIQKISSKGREGDLVTNVDIEIENKIKDFLSINAPNITILAEESGMSKIDDGLMWCIDPLDGTTNYSHGYPFFGTSIGLVYKNIPLIGAISVPYLDELYWGCINKGAYCNDK